jgi:hypothetical protein
VEDAEKLHAEYKARGVKIRMPPTNHSWALEFQVEDPDGNVLRLGSEPKDDRPFEDHNLEVTNMLEELTLKDKLSLYEDGKHRRYSLLFAVNGGAFAVANLLANEGARSKVLGQLSLAELSWGMILFTVVMVADIYAFGLKFKPNAFGPIGKLVLISIGLIICAGWLLAGCAQ